MVWFVVSGYTTALVDVEQEVLAILLDEQEVLT